MEGIVSPLLLDPVQVVKLFVEQLTVTASDQLFVHRSIFSFVLKPLLEWFIRTGIRPGPLFAVLIQILLILRRGKDGWTPGNRHFETPFGELKTRYDYIVVGGGIAGCVVAKRLAVKHTVLLIHGPGGAPGPLLRVPFFSVLNLGDPDHDYLYKSIEIPTMVWEGHLETYNAGKDFGGSQLLSANVWSYGKPADFEAWRNVGVTQFDFETLRKKGARHENATAAVRAGQISYAYGTQGEIQLRKSDTPEFFRKYQEAFVTRGATATSTTPVTDYNDDTLGFSGFIQAIEDDTGFISTGPRAFFEKNRPPKLHIVLRSMVTKIVLRNTTTGFQATGVEWMYHGSTKLTTNATRKVVLSGGSIKTPQLLMLSGIGGKAILKSLNITTKVDRPGVGENFHDHFDIGQTFVCFPNKSYIDVQLPWLLDFLYQLRKPNLLKNVATVSSVGFFNTRLREYGTCANVSDAKTCRPDFELILQSISPNNQLAAYLFLAGGEDYSTYVDDFYLANKDEQKNFFPLLKLVPLLDKYLNQPECLMMTPTVLHPEGRGRIRLQSTNILDNPIIDFDPQKSARDVALMTDLLIQVQDIVKAVFGGPDLQGRYNTMIDRECAKIDPVTNATAFNACMVKRYWKTAWHPAGTCRIGRPDDPKAVVNDHFNVIGVKNLGIVDGSVLIAPTSGHMLAVISALAEWAAEIWNDE